MGWQTDQFRASFPAVDGLFVRYKMKNSRWPLRLLILACIAFGAGSLVVDRATQDSLPSGLREFYYSGFFDQHPALAIGMGIVFVGLMVFSWIGLWFFWNPARYTYAVALTVTWITTPLLGPSVSTAWGGTLEETSTMADGAILLMIFFGDQRKEFGKANKASRTNRP